LILLQHRPIVLESSQAIIKRAAKDKDTVVQPKTSQQNITPNVSKQSITTSPTPSRRLQQHRRTTIHGHAHR
jgi:hypothetical protein